MLDRSHSLCFRPETLVESPEMMKIDGSTSNTGTGSVKIVDYQDGVLGFYVRMRSRTTQCIEVKNKLQSIEKLTQMSNPIVGDVCIVKFDGRRLRARICLPEQKNRFKVQLLESGTIVNIEAKNIFNIPEDLSIIPAFARKFKLAGFDRKSIPHLNQSEVDFYFQQLTKNNIYKIKIVAESEISQVLIKKI